MNNKHGIAFILLFIGFTFSVMAGGSGEQTTGTNNNTTNTQTANVPATANAADLVRALGGKATANGNTVTLTADVTLVENMGIENTVLIVPAGVTLDLTQDGATLYLLDNTTLTVNGIVNARGAGNGKDGGLSIPGGTTIINGNGTINLTSKGSLLSIWSGDGNSRKLILDGVTLVGLADNDESLVRVLEGSELVLISGTITGNTRTNAENPAGGGVEIYKATFIMEGGTITGNTVVGNNYAEGGGVKVQEGTFTMRGGEISGNTSRSTTNNGIGGGLRFAGDDCTFTMTDGRITGNAAIGGVGGGLSFDCLKGVFTMEGGEISGNSAGTGRGGGMWIGGGTLIMKGGTIYGSANSLPAGTNASLANSAQTGATLELYNGGPQWSYWGTGGTYTMGGVPKNGGSAILTSGQNTNETLIAIPPRQ